MEARVGIPQGTFCGVTIRVISPSLLVPEESEHLGVSWTIARHTARIFVDCYCIPLHLPHFHLQGWSTVKSVECKV